MSSVVSLSLFKSDASLCSAESAPLFCLRLAASKYRRGLMGRTPACVYIMWHIMWQCAMIWGQWVSYQSKQLVDGHCGLCSNRQPIPTGAVSLTNRRQHSYTMCSLDPLQVQTHYHFLVVVRHGIIATNLVRGAWHSTGFLLYWIVICTCSKCLPSLLDLLVATTMW